MLKVRQIGLAAVAAMAVTLTGCGSSAPQKTADLAAEPEYSGTLSILTKFGGEPLESYFSDLAAEYTAMHPDVKFELIQETDQSIKDKTKTLTASQALPDIYFTWAGDWAANFVEAGLAADLTPVIEPGTEWGDTFGEASLSAFQYDGKYYAVPLYNNGKFMGYNEKIFAEVGIQPPTSFDELISACGTIRDAGYEPVAFGNKDGWPALHYLQQLFAYNVPQDTLQADFDPETATWDDEGYVKSLEQFSTLVEECTGSGADSNGVLYTTAQQALAEGRAAMYYQEILEFDTSAAEGTPLSKDGFGIFPLPVPAGAEGDPGAIEGSPEGYIINARSERAALAADFMKFVTESENASTLSAPPYGQPSAVVGAVTADSSSPGVVNGIEMVNDASSTVIWLDSVTVPDVADAWLAGGEALISGDSTPEDILSSVQAASEASK
ncbi:ABC transporter substrate-binding protein [Arthrobacter sp. SX1312]|uniref:ABC transporter substrate-binding protein n=1 Tax=Arthrobacter sp. SX1312 TaxID=2058896 RepID=UPI000CE41730|nr:extracellular solute-binding protein [Arthrobacter sp. SX1312]